MNIVTVIISVVLFFVIFFGIGFLLNMLLRVTWFMAMVYPIVVILIVGGNDKKDSPGVGFFDYIFHPGTAFPTLWEKTLALHSADIIILTGGFVGAITAGIVMKLLRKSGYRMF